MCRAFENSIGRLANTSYGVSPTARVSLDRMGRTFSRAFAKVPAAGFEFSTSCPDRSDESVARNHHGALAWTHPAERDGRTGKDHPATDRERSAISLRVYGHHRERISIIRTTTSIDSRRSDSTARSSLTPNNRTRVCMRIMSTACCCRSGSSARV